jgi:gamma-glutamyl AIG2-like cyclotransferase
MPAADQDTALFVYGTLLDAPLRRGLFGREVDTIPARLIDYERRRGRYFHVVRRAGAETAGLVLTGLAASDLAVLDRYEEAPRLYSRERAVVLDATGRKIRCWLYLPTPLLLKG